MKRKMFDSLVENALDFMRRAIEDIDKRPKESVINIWNSVELFLKARLMLEHWALVVDKSGDADTKKFAAGDFISVGMKEALKRLEAIAGETFGKEERDCINTLREHRNRLVHFFNPAYVGKPDKQVVQKVVAEQCRCWYYLHNRLCGPWRKHFARHATAISDLNKQMLSLRAFLKVKFKSLAETIAADQAAGVTFLVCESCGFKAAKEEEILDPKFGSHCLVCDYRAEFLKVPCPECAKVVRCRDGSGECDCGEKLDLSFLLDTFGSATSLKDEATEPSHAYCCECHYLNERTVVPIRDQWLCLQCLTVHGEAGFCEWCNDHVTGDLEDSYLNGCMMCEGRFG